MRRFSAAYPSFAILFTNTVVLFLFLNGVLQCFDWIMGPDRTPSEPSEWVYRPYVQYGEKRRGGASPVFRDEFGFEYRASREFTTQEMREAAFLFGGTEAFGDLAPLLEAKLGRPVLSYSARHYNSIQSTLLAQRLLQAGHRPRVFVFLDDGEFRTEPATQKRMKEIWERSQYDRLHIGLPNEVPLFRWVNRMREAYFDHRLKQEGETRYPELKEKAKIDRDALNGIRRAMANSVRGRTFTFMTQSAESVERTAERMSDEILQNI